jgi:hypothetical protein
MVFNPTHPSKKNLNHWEFFQMVGPIVIQVWMGLTWMRTWGSAKMSSAVARPRASDVDEDGAAAAGGPWRRSIERDGDGVERDEATEPVAGRGGSAHEVSHGGGPREVRAYGCLHRGAARRVREHPRIATLWTWIRTSSAVRRRNTASRRASSDGEFVPSSRSSKSSSSSSSPSKSNSSSSWSWVREDGG